MDEETSVHCGGTGLIACAPGSEVTVRDDAQFDVSRDNACFVGTAFHRTRVFVKAANCSWSGGDWEYRRCLFRAYVFLGCLFRLPELQIVIFYSAACYGSFFRFCFSGLRFEDLVRFRVIYFRGFRAVGLSCGFSVVLFERCAPRLCREVFFVREYRGYHL